jgi:hypothetical protein
VAGPVSASGEHFLSGLNSWSSPANPSVITVSEADWTRNSSLTIVTAVHPNAVDSDFNGWFDRITLVPGGSGLPFRDGFEDP